MSSEDPLAPEDDEARRPHFDRAELQATALRGVKWTLVHTVFSIALGFGVNIILARVLGVADYGRLAYLTTVIMIAGLIAELGLGMGVVQFGAKMHAVGDRAGVSSLLSKSQGYRLLLIAPVVTLAALSVVRADPLMMALAVVVGIWVKAALGGAAASLTLENKTHRIAQNAMLVNFLTQAGVLLVVLTVGEADAVWATRIVIGTLGVVLALPYIDRAYRRAVLKPGWPRQFPRGFWGYAVPAGLASILGNLVISRSEVLFLTWFDMGLAAGLYAAAFGLAGHVFSPAQALVGPLIPAISSLREVDPNAVGRALRRTLRGSSTIVGLLVAGGLAPLSLLIPLIYGADYAGSSLPFLALGLGAAVATVGGPLFAFIQARLAGRAMLRINVAALSVNLALIVILLPMLGLWGAVIANLAGVLVRNVMLLTGELRDTGVALTKTLHDMAPLMVSALACLMAVAVVSIFPGTELLSAVLAGVVGVLVFVVGLWITRSGLTGLDRSAVSASVPAWADRPAKVSLRFLTHRR